MSAKPSLDESVRNAFQRMCFEKKTIVKMRPNPIRRETCVKGANPSLTNRDTILKRGKQTAVRRRAAIEQDLLELGTLFLMTIPLNLTVNRMLGERLRTGVRVLTVNRNRTVWLFIRADF